RTASRLRTAEGQRRLGTPHDREKPEARRTLDRCRIHLARLVADRRAPAHAGGRVKPAPTLRLIPGGAQSGSAAPATDAPDAPVHDTDTAPQRVSRERPLGP